MTKAEARKEASLIEICKAKQGAYLLPGSGSGSWSTTYSNEFIDAAIELYNLYEKAGYYPEVSMSWKFRESGIKSCRGAEMTIDKVQYLCKTHLLKKKSNN